MTSSIDGLPVLIYTALIVIGGLIIGVGLGALLAGLIRLLGG